MLNISTHLLLESQFVYVMAHHHHLLPDDRLLYFVSSVLDAHFEQTDQSLQLLQIYIYVYW